MGMRIPSNRAAECLVDKYIGPAYEDVHIVAENIDLIKSTASGIGSIDTILPYVDAITNVSNIAPEVVIVADNITDVNTVSLNIAAIDNVSLNMAELAVIGNNIDAILKAPESAIRAETAAIRSEDAAASATLSETAARNSASYAESYKDTALQKSLEAAQSATTAQTHAGTATTQAYNASQASLGATAAEANALIHAGTAKTQANLASGSATAAALSASDAETSKTETALIKDEVEKLYDILSKDMVYRGGWNPNTQVYPDPMGTNSKWDVFLDPGQDTFDWNNITWKAGDTLTYSKEQTTYIHIANITGVVSVQGKKGVVTLIPSDIGAPTAAQMTAAESKIVSLEGDVQGTTADIAALKLTTQTNATAVQANSQNISSNSQKITDLENKKTYSLFEPAKTIYTYLAGDIIKVVDTFAGIGDRVTDFTYSSGLLTRVVEVFQGVTKTWVYTYDPDGTLTGVVYS